MNKARIMVLFVLGPMICLQLACIYGLARKAPWEHQWYQAQKDWLKAFDANDYAGMQDALNRSVAALCGESRDVWYLPADPKCP
jgi:hypothetical protein